MTQAVPDDSVQLCWNDPASLLGGMHWRLARGGEEYRTVLHRLVRAVAPDLANRCLDAHLDALASVLGAADELQARLVEGLGKGVAGTPGAVGVDSPMGASCRQAAAAVDAMVYELSRALTALERPPDERAARLVLDAAHVSVYLRSLIGLHTWPGGDAS
ncbi:MAG: hypothetical protein WD080_01805 [Egibacteraceae bacterium]